MRTPILTIAALGLLVCLAPARINETREQCLARYGQPTETIPTLLEKSEVAADVFRRPGLKITIEYRGQKAWMITYSGKEVSKESVEKILALNAKDGGWKSASYFDGQHWLAKAAGLHAVYYKTPGARLVVMNKAALEADWKPRVAAAADEPEPIPGEGTPTTPAPTKPTDGKPDPLEGL